MSEVARYRLVQEQNVARLEGIDQLRVILANFEAFVASISAGVGTDVTAAQAAIATARAAAVAAVSALASTASTDVDAAVAAATDTINDVADAATSAVNAARDTTLGYRDVALAARNEAVAARDIAVAALPTDDLVSDEQDGDLIFVDEDRKKIFSTGENRRHLAALDAREQVSVRSDLLDGYLDGATLIVDGDGRMIIEIASGNDNVQPVSYTAGDLSPASRDEVTKCAIPPRFLASAVRPTIMLWLQYGQSLAIAGNSDNGPGPGGIDSGRLYTSAPIYPDRIFMLNGVQGYRAVANLSFTDTGLEPGYEKYVASYGESGMGAFLNRLYKFCYDAVGDGPLLGGIVGGAGGTAAQDLGRGTAPYNALLASLQRYVSYADQAGMDVVVAGIRGIHGNANGPNTLRAMFERYWRKIRADMEVDIKLLTGQTDPVLLYLDQQDGGSTGDFREVGTVIGALDAANNDPMVRNLAMHGDIPRDAAGSVHPSSLGYLWMGERDARTVFRDYFCAGTHPFQIVRQWRKAANKIGLIIHVPVTPLVIDTSNTLMDTTMLDAGLGFQFDDGSGAPPAITAVTLINGALSEGPAAEIEITLASAPTGLRWRLFHAMKSYVVAGGTYPFTAFRDSAPDTSTFTTAGVAASGGNGRPLPQFMCRQVVDI